MFSKNGSIPKAETDGTDGWIEVPDAPIAPEGKEVVWWYPPGWVIRDPKPEGDWSWSQSTEQWVEHILQTEQIQEIVPEQIQIIDSQQIQAIDSLQFGALSSQDIDAFVPPQPYPSWTLDANVAWQPPVSYPTDGKIYSWNEESQTWVEVNG